MIAAVCSAVASAGTFVLVALAYRRATAASRERRKMLRKLRRIGMGQLADAIERHTQ